MSELTLHFFDGIEPQELESFMSVVDKAQSGDTVTIDLCNGGGSVFHGIAICDRMAVAQSNGIKFVANVWGFSASAACLVALSCDEINMSPNSALMYHSAWNFDGTVDEGIEIANLGQKTLLSKRIGKISSEDFNGEDHWITSTQALEAGIIDNIIGNATSSESSQDLRIAARYIFGGMDMQELKKAKAEEQIKPQEEEQKAPVEEQKAPEAEGECGEENKDDPKAEDLDILEMIANRLEDIEKRLSVLEGAGNKVEESNPQPEPSARRKALMQKLASVCAPIPSAHTNPVAVSESPSEEATRFKSVYKNFDSIMADYIKRK